MHDNGLRRVVTDGFPVLARGGQAEIYDCGESRVLRVARRPQDFDAIRREYAVYCVLAQAGLPVPRAYELVDVGGAPAILMDRLSGPTMQQALASHPLRTARFGRELALLHAEIGRHSVATQEIRTTRAKAEWCIGRSRNLPESSGRAVREILQGLPDGDALCHGDFHPGNIILHDGTSYLIDWVGASRGDFLADVAHTYLLLRVVPRLPHVGRFLHMLQVRVGRALAESYLAQIASLGVLDYRRFSAWLLVNAAERTYHGLPSEQERLLLFIEGSVRWLTQGGKEEDLYRLL